MDAPADYETVMWCRTSGLMGVCGGWPSEGPASRISDIISAEPIYFLWDRLSLELEHLAAPRRPPHVFLEATLCRFSGEIFNLGDDVFTCVANPAGRAGKEVLGLSTSGALKGYATRAAKDGFIVISH